MKTTTRHFGEITVDENKKIIFKEGLPGFESLREFIIIEEEENVFCYLQSVEDGQIAFAIIDPTLITTEYNPIVHERYFEKLGGGEDGIFAIYVIANIGTTIESTTVNLQAPLIIHTENRLGVQAISDDNRYVTKHQMIELIKERNQ